MHVRFCSPRVLAPSALPRGFGGLLRKHPPPWTHRPAGWYEANGRRVATITDANARLVIDDCYAPALFEAIRAWYWEDYEPGLAQATLPPGRGAPAVSAIDAGAGSDSSAYVLLERSAEGGWTMWYSEAAAADEGR